jgi:PTH1 family peptidyl-tRNA hydrolase
MKLIFGLGNPDAKYARTRHNFGFRAIDFFAEQFEFPEFRLEKKFRAEVSEKEIRGEKIFLAKPQTFMNLSGESAGAILKFFKPALADFLTISDDVDLPFGTIRIREGGSAGGHRGIRNLIAHFGTENFARLRLGIANELLDLVPTEEFVLSRFSQKEEAAIPKILGKTSTAIDDFLKNGATNLTIPK